MTRALAVLGCASQAPTRYRNHNGYFLRWDAEGILFDPGEGTQRQLLLAGVPASSITRICITHFHGDHCLGLPGVLGRLALDRVARPIPVAYPAGGQPWFERLCDASVSDRHPVIVPQPVHAAGVVDSVDALRVVDSVDALRVVDSVDALRVVDSVDAFTLRAAPLDHRTPTVGWRIDEPDGHRLLPDRLEAAGIAGAEIGRLKREGTLTRNGRRVTLAEVSVERKGQSAAFIMDTRLCDSARELADGVDLLVCESTYLEAEAGLAEAYGHLTAAQAAHLARDSGARRLVLTHYSARHPDASAYLEEAAPIFSETVVVKDLDVIPVPARL